MSIERTATGAVVVTGEHIDLLRLLALEGALKLEAAGYHSRRSVAAQVRREFGFKGNAAKLREQVAALRVERFGGAR